MTRFLTVPVTSIQCLWEIHCLKYLLHLKHSQECLTAFLSAWMSFNARPNPMTWVALPPTAKRVLLPFQIQVFPSLSSLGVPSPQTHTAVLKDVHNRPTAPSSTHSKSQTLLHTALYLPLNLPSDHQGNLVPATPHPWIAGNSTKTRFMIKLPTTVSQRARFLSCNWHALLYWKAFPESPLHRVRLK